MIEEKTRVPNPSRFELFDSESRWIGTYDTALAAWKVANDLWPDQELDPDRTGAGWYIDKVGAGIIHQHSPLGPAKV